MDDHDYTLQRVNDTCTAQGFAVVPDDAVVDVIAAMIADRPVQTDSAA